MFNFSCKSSVHSISKGAGQIFNLPRTDDFSQPVRLKLIEGKFRQDALALTPFVAKSKQQPIKVRSTDTISRTNGVAPTELWRFWELFCYKQGRY